MKRLIIGFALLTVCPSFGIAQDTTRVSPDTTRMVSVGGFIDAYYAWDFNRPGPATFDRSFTTQPARHDEFNVNLAFVELKLAAPHTRGRLALQAGTSVQSNYAGEPRYGAISGPDLARLVQEATAGVQLGSRLWIDGGIYLSHIGQESWISRDNPTYTRSLIADYSPYYETGIKATWSARSKVTAQLHVLNGWQIISENNQNKAIGMRVDYALSPNVALGYDNFIGDEQPDTVPSRVRVFNEIFGAFTAGKAQFWLTFDYGLQGKNPASGSSSWWGGAAIGKLKVTPKVSLSVRIERYADPDGVIVTTGTPSAFRVTGESLGLDVIPFRNVLWRIEVRGLHGDDAIFPKRGLTPTFSGSDGFIASSLALTL